MAIRVAVPIAVADPDAADTAHLGADPLAHGGLDLPRLLDGPVAGDGELDVDEVVLAAFDAGDVADLDVTADAAGVEARAGVPRDRGADVVVDAAVGELVEGADRVLGAGLDDEERDEEAADGVEPGGVGEDVGAEDDGEGDDARERVDAVVHGVGGEDGGFATKLTCVVEPLLDGHGAGGQPRGVQTGPGMAVAVAAVGVAVVHVSNGVGGGGGVEEEVGVQGQQAAPEHEEAAAEEHARDAEGAEALDLAEAGGEGVGRRLQGPRDGGEGQDVGGEVGQRVPGVGDEGLGAKGVAAGALGKGHAEVGEEADAGDADAGVVLVGGGQRFWSAPIVRLMLADAVEGSGKSGRVTVSEGGCGRRDGDRSGGGGVVIRVGRVLWQRKARRERGRCLG
ncbi:hypothetical protein BN1708_015683 [Verticillium longisporum]|uniref:Uncharacterized protein n=1 Tax=Verticillium longisporum TaxID=100787 RepID=A0A0G4M6N4_VERLO|nr:hypothetical protein BN1708_015683 [Verticillium longisporum]